MNGRTLHTVGADPHKNQVYVPIIAIGGGAPTFAPTICSSAATKIGLPANITPTPPARQPADLLGCIAVFTTNNNDDDNNDNNNHDDRAPPVRHERDDN